MLPFRSSGYSFLSIEAAVVTSSLLMSGNSQRKENFEQMVSVDLNLSTRATIHK